ncbi:tonsoku-like protein isoform X3 [Eurytemora carolleeae]|uniref:tonsoku-like protein isoform X2 n=1 Tax=Eurytemora carolleeae TaxID=1294199 RepID=UPI000C7723D2|nr:tonsoku-like protein isoform X2 [Eurytemora carolleeae]XP_023339210.1 tonsoku-like protein isoform X3 [Eurytemora carolleeae]|eukprot:XP_023339209.1 tonsoku-like protein isoform X2 [Eurytemora affinis]
MDRTDLLEDVLATTDSLHGVVLSWPYKPSHERYLEISKNLGFPVYKNIATILHRAEATKSLILRMPLKFKIITPLVGSLKSWLGLREIVFAGCKIGENFNVFKPVLNTLKSLSLLNLSQNCLLPVYLENIVLPPNLDSLNLAHNPFQDHSLRFLSPVLMSSPVLSTLDLSYCSFTHRLFNTGCIEFTQAISGLTDLNIAGNDLGPEGIEILLKCCPTTLTTLNLSATVSGSDGNLLKGLVSFCQRGNQETRLETILLRNCYLSDINIPDLCTAVSSLPRLKKLDLSSNGVTPSGVHQLLTRVAETDRQLTDLLLDNCHMVIGQGYEEMVNGVKILMDWL